MWDEYLDSSSIYLKIYINLMYIKVSVLFYYILLFLLL